MSRLIVLAALFTATSSPIWAEVDTPPDDPAQVANVYEGFDPPPGMCFLAPRTYPVDAEVLDLMMGLLLEPEVALIAALDCDAVKEMRQKEEIVRSERQFSVSFINQDEAIPDDPVEREAYWKSELDRIEALGPTQAGIFPRQFALPVGSSFQGTSIPIGVSFSGSYDKDGIYLRFATDLDGGGAGAPVIVGIITGAGHQQVRYDMIDFNPDADREIMLEQMGNEMRELTPQIREKGPLLALPQ